MSMEFSRQEYWSGSGLPFPSPVNLPNSGIESGSPAFQAYFFYHLSPTGQIQVLAAESLFR